MRLLNSKGILQRYKELKDLISILGLDELPEENRITVIRARRVERFLSQPLFVATPYTNMPGKFVELSCAITGFHSILSGNFDSISELAFVMKEDINELC